MLLRRLQLFGAQGDHKVTAMPTADDERLLTLAELAGYLHMGQKTILKLAETKKIPGVLIDREWRFRRTAVESWLESQSAGEGQRFEEVPDGMVLPLGDLLPETAIVHEMRARDPLAAIEELAARAYGNRWLNDKPWFIGAIVEREVLASTAMEGGVAFLHTRSREADRISRPFIIVGRSYDGIDFGAPDGKSTYLFFLLGLKYDRLHLPLLGRLARIMARSPLMVAKLRATTSPTKIRNTLLQLDAEEMDTRMKATDGQLDSPLVVAPRMMMSSARPALDRETRLRAIRLSAQKKPPAPPATGKRGKPRASAASAGAKVGKGGQPEPAAPPARPAAAPAPKRQKPTR